MKFHCLGSSSSGNCFIFEFDNGSLMVECGIKISALYQKCLENEIEFKKVKNCLITHSHKDHCLSATNLLNRGIAVYGSQSALEQQNIKGRAIYHNKSFEVLNGLFITPFTVYHDIDGCYGYILQERNETIVFINDHKCWTCDLSEIKPNYIFIECNYIKDLLPKDENKSVRQINSHCGLDDTVRGLNHFDLSECKEIYLMHLSDGSSNEKVMKETVENETKIKTYICKKKGGIAYE